MKTTRLAGCCLFFAAAACYGADIGVATIVEGGARVLRGATWYKLVEGARIQDVDVIDAADRAQVQVELTSGPIVNFVGPVGILAVAAGTPGGGAKGPAAPAEVYLPGGWLKLAVKPRGAPLRVRIPSGSVAASDGVAVVHAEKDAVEIFVETGAAKLYEPARVGIEGAAHDVKSGEFALRAADRPFATAGAAPQSFIAGLPRHFRVPVPALAAQYAVTRVQLVPDRPISYAEAEPWLGSPYRRLFIKRLQPRLADPEFRTAAMAKPQAYPEWQSALAPAAAEPPRPETAKAEPPKAEPPKPEKAEKASIFKWPFGDNKK